MASRPRDTEAVSPWVKYLDNGGWTWHIVRRNARRRLGRPGTGGKRIGVVFVGACIGRHLGVSTRMGGDRRMSNHRTVRSGSPTRPVIGLAVWVALSSMLIAACGNGSAPGKSSASSVSITSGIERRLCSRGSLNWQPCNHRELTIGPANAGDNGIDSMSDSEPRRLRPATWLSAAMTLNVRSAELKMISLNTDLTEACGSLDRGRPIIGD